MQKYFMDEFVGHTPQGVRPSIVFGKHCLVEKVTVDWYDGKTAIPLTGRLVASRENMSSIFNTGVVAVNVYLNID